jgi:hypothetical protein
MADEPTLRSYRSNDPYRQADAPSRSGGQASDPLAELARLLGKNDPFAEFGRSDSRQRAQSADAASSTAPDDWRYATAGEPQYSADASAASAGREGYAPSPYDAHQDQTRQDYEHQDYAHPSAHDPDRWRADPQVQEEVPLAADHQGQYPDDGGQQGGQHDDRPQDGHDADYYYEDDVPLEPNENAMYDDPPGTRRHSGLVIALALIGCALVGTAGAYGYRTYFGSPGSTQPPPVITADNSTPTKIVPATAGDPQSGKAVQDRVAAAEQLVSKQEEPVALREPATQVPSRVVPPPPAAAPAQAGSAAPASAATAPQAGEPKKIRTVTIRPDGGDMSARPVGAPSGATTATTTAAAPRPATPPAPRAPAPQASEPAAPAPAPKVRTATAPAPRAEENAGFVVQLSSQKSESEAQTSFRSLQAKFPDELGGRQPIIRRADLGSKGVFYRTLVGPFASAHEASQFCANYKAAGGQCVVPNN